MKKGHVYFVDIRPLLSVHLYVDEMFIHQIAHLLTLKRLPLHHMTPVARRVTNYTIKMSKFNGKLTAQITINVTVSAIG